VRGFVQILRKRRRVTLGPGAAYVIARLGVRHPLAPGTQKEQIAG
jgi:hypothetical protein